MTHDHVLKYLSHNLIMSEKTKNSGTYNISIALGFVVALGGLPNRPRHWLLSLWLIDKKYIWKSKLEIRSDSLLLPLHHQRLLYLGGIDKRAGWFVEDPMHLVKKDGREIRLQGFRVS